MLIGAALVFAGSLGLSDAFALAFQHDLPSPGRHAGQDRQHELAGRVAEYPSRSPPILQDHQADAALREVGLDGEQLASCCVPADLPAW